LDEKMKDAVKITVIATGFRECEMRRPRHHESFDPVIVSREISRQRDRFHEPEPEANPEPVFEPAFEPDPAPVAFQQSTTASAAHAEVISFDAMNSVPPSYEAEDLDVPAFLRKRSEVM